MVKSNKGPEAHSTDLPEDSVHFLGAKPVAIIAGLMSLDQKRFFFPNITAITPFLRYNHHIFL